MRSLLILRHAEATAPRSGETDIDRQLTERGCAQANALGARFGTLGVNPQRVLCSVAERAQKTADIAVAAAGLATKVNIIDDLYNASCHQLLVCVKQQTNEVAQLLLVAHAPGVAELVSILTTGHDDLVMDYEAGTLAEITFESGRWSEIDKVVGVLRLLLPPHC